MKPEAAAHSQSSIPLYKDFWLLGILCTGATLRLFHLTARSLWLDEATSLYVAAKSLADICSGAGFDSHTPPLYYAILSIWLHLFPRNELGLRLFSLTIDLLNIYLIAKILGAQFTQKLGRAAASLYAMSAYAVYYAQEGRMYTMLALLVLCTYGLALETSRSGNSGTRRPLLFIIAVAGMYTHYYYALALLGITLALTINLRHAGKEARGWFFVMLAVAVAYTPWIRVVLSLAASGGQSFRRFTFEMLPYTAFRFSAGYGVMPLYYDTKRSIGLTLFDHIPELVLFTAVFGPLILVSIMRLIRADFRNAVFLLTPLVFVPAAATLISLKMPLLSERYLIAVYPFFITLLAFGVLSMKGLPGRLLASAAGLLSCFALFMHHFNPGFGNTQWRDAAAYIQAASPAPADVYVQPGYADDLLRFYLREPFTVHPAQPGQPEFPPAGQTSFWLVEQGYEGLIKDSLEQSGFRVAAEEYFPKENGLSAARLERPAQSGVTP